MFVFVNSLPTEQIKKCVKTCRIVSFLIQEAFYVYLNKFETAVTHLFLNLVYKNGFT